MLITNRGSTRGKSLQSDKICLLPIEDPQGEKSLQQDKICLLPIEDPQGENHYSKAMFITNRGPTRGKMITVR